jgi:hypothetical protein
VKRRDLVAAISELEPATIEGRFERHTSLRWKELMASAAGGRWGARGAFDVLYLGRPRESVIAEAYRHLIDDELDAPHALAATVLERRILTFEVSVQGVLDLRDEVTRRAVELPEAALYSGVGDYRPCQTVGAAAHAAGLPGVVAPAATRLGETLALFTANLQPSAWPALRKREIWSGLPTDPRSAKGG